MNKNKLLEIYKNFHLIRFSQQYLMEIYHPENKMRCPIHFCLGQEALASCASILLKKNDFILSHHRSHGYYLAKKSPINKMISEFYGKAEGSNFGLAGSQELSYSKNNFHSGTILSGMFSIALGTSFAQKINKTNDITMTIIGDGGMEEGIVYETLNLASLHSLPIIFICENNQYSVHTNMKDRTKSKNFEKKVKSFDVEYLRINDYRIENIYQKIEKIFFKVRKKSKPIFVEIDTMRTCGHVGPENDDKEFNYRNAELSKWKNKDTAKQFKKSLLKFFSEKLINNIEKKNEKIVKFAVKKAREQKHISFNKSLEVNFIKSYSKIIKKFSKPKTLFDKGQLDTKLAPY
jgi:TPP-dependent pyruvate/acetoin dehydrogenase alpha subunit